MRIHKNVLLIVGLILAAGVFGWIFGHMDNPKSIQSNSSTQSSANTDSTAGSASSLVSYDLPNGWKDASCDATSSTIYIVPNGASAPDCTNNPSSAITLSVDGAGPTDCNQLQNNQDVKKHVCISLYINGHKSLKSSTEYLPTSSYGKDTTISTYYIDTGSGVVRVEYAYTSTNLYQAGFDQLANSVRKKG